MFQDAQNMLKSMVARKSLRANAVIAFYRARSVGDDIEVLNQDGSVRETLHGLRQQVGQSAIEDGAEALGGERQALGPRVGPHAAWSGL